MIFVDATQARYLDLIPFTNQVIGAATKDLDWFEAIRMREESALSGDEYAAFLKVETDPKNQDQRAAEFIALMDSYAISATKHGFFNRQPPVCVIKGHDARDLERAYEAKCCKGKWDGKGEEQV